jgi:hypothetical protein
LISGYFRRAAHFCFCAPDFSMFVDWACIHWRRARASAAGDPLHPHRRPRHVRDIAGAVKYGKKTSIGLLQRLFFARAARH